MPEYNDTISFNDDVLKKLEKALGNVPTARVGILGTKTNRFVMKGSVKTGKLSPLRVKNEAGKSVRVKEDVNNAMIGAAHEFGTSTLPQRSFLRVPLTAGLGKELEERGAFSENTLKEVIASGSVRAWMKKVAIVAEAVIADAFATGGNGKWESHYSEHYQNHTGDILVDTAQLRNSITSKVD